MAVIESFPSIIHYPQQQLGWFLSDREVSHVRLDILPETLKTKFYEKIKCIHPSITHKIPNPRHLSSSIKKGIALAAGNK